MESAIKSPTQPTNLLTFLLGQPETISFNDGYNEDPTWFSPSLLFLVSAESSTSHCLTFGRLKHLVKAIASGLRKRGLQPGDRLLLTSPDNVYMPVMMLATIAAGGIFVGRRPDYTAEQQATAIKHCEPTLVLAYKGFQEVAAKAIQLADVTAHLISYDHLSFEFPPGPTHNLGDPVYPVSLDRFVDHEGAQSFQWATFQADADPEATVLIVFTTGSTGDSKGVELTHRSLLAVSSIYQHFTVASSNQENWIENYSFGFLAATIHFLLALKSRNQLILYDYPAFDLENFLESIIRHKCNTVFVSKQAADKMAAGVPSPGLSHVSRVLTGGTIIPHATRQAINDLFCKPVLSVIYASSEAGCPIPIEPPGSPAGPSSFVGNLLPGVQGRVVDDDGNILGKGENGNLQWHTRAVMKGYWRNPKATSEIFTEDGWLKIGDLGYFDAQGGLHITGRAKEGLKVKGRPVSPSNIEETLMEIPGVSIACVVGIRDQQGEDLPKAYIVRNDSASKQLIEEEDVHAFMKEKMNADHQLTGGLEFVKAEWVPYGGNGKVLRRVVQERAQKAYDSGDDREKVNAEPQDTSIVEKVKQDVAAIVEEIKGVVIGSGSGNEGDKEND